MTPTARTLEEVRSRGWLACVAEHWQGSFAERPVMEAAKAWRQRKSSDTEAVLFDAIRRLENSGPGRRVDLFGFIDIVALGDGQIHGIQCTATSGQAARKNKVLGECSEQAQAWLAAGGRIWIVGWKKYAQPIDRKLWRPTWQELTAADFVTEPAF